MNETIDTGVNFTPDELCATVEALYEAISNRFRWTVSSPEEGSGAEVWQTLDIEVAQAALDMLVAAYSKSMMVLRSWPDDAIHPEFLEMYSLPDLVWDLLAEITNAKDWDHMPMHSEDYAEDCEICQFLMNH